MLDCIGIPSSSWHAYANSFHLLDSDAIARYTVIWPIVKVYLPLCYVHNLSPKQGLQLHRQNHLTLLAGTSSFIATSHIEHEPSNIHVKTIS
jgi:prepilin signal peptidase PulO-like enzyme (type II secretory pathway)